MDRFAEFSLIAAREAVGQAGIEWDDELREQTAIITGSCIGGRIAEEAGYWNLFHLNKNRVHPLTIPLGMANSGASQVSMEFGVHGPTFTFSTACSSLAHALGHAFWMVRSGAVPLAIAGGADAPIYFGNMKAWEAMRVVSQDTCRPFSLDRAGMILGEGSAMLVLEPLDAALARGARPLRRLSALACPLTPATLPSRLPRARPGRFAGRSKTAAWHRSRSAISTPTAPAPKPTTNGVCRDSPGLWRPRRQDADQLDEIDAWSHPGRRRSDRGRGDGIRPRPGDTSQPRTLLGPIRTVTWT